MNVPGRRTPVWETDGPRPHYPRLGPERAFDVAVIGAGITGLTTALRLKEAGKKVAVFDLGAVGGGATGHTSAHLTACPDLPFGLLVSKFGEETARRVVQSHVDAISAIEETVGRHRIECDFRRVPGFRYTESEAEAAVLAEEARLAARLGLRADFTRDVGLPFPTPAAVRLQDQARFHPLRYLLALSERVDGGGSAVFERCRVEEVEDGSPCRLQVQGGTVEAGAVVHATHTPINVVLSIHTRIVPSMTYLLAFRSNQAVPDALFWDTADPYHYLRRLEDERGPILLVGGMDHQSGDEPDTPSRFRGLLEYAMERFSVMDVIGSWSYEILDPVDGLPFIGRKPGADHVYLATGFSGTGLTYGTLAGGILSDLILGRESPWEDLFSPGRVRPLASAKDFLKENLHVAWRLLADRPVTRAEINVMAKATRKMKKMIFAIPAAPAASPPNPRTAAMIATMKNARAQLSMHHLHSVG